MPSLYIKLMRGGVGAKEKNKTKKILQMKALQINSAFG